MFRAGLVSAAVFGFLSLIPGAIGQAPALPYYDWNACPFEGRVYRQWTSRGGADVYDTCRPGCKKIAHLAKGDAVTGVTGVVITFQPGLIRLDGDVPEAGLKKGETILTYAHRGEGFSAVWLHGKYVPEYDISFTKWPDGQGRGNEHCAATYVDLGKKVWWARTKLARGGLGWVNMNESHFDGVDILA